VARHAQQLVLPVLDAAERSHVAGLDAEHPREPRAAEASPPLGSRSELAQHTIPPPDTGLPERHAQKTSERALDPTTPPRVLGVGLDEAEQQLLEIVAHHGGNDSESLDALLGFVDHAARARDATLDAPRRKAGGVVHTPVVLARAMVREADALLARHGLPRLGDDALEVIDPATGPGVFLAAVLAHAHAKHAHVQGIDVDRRASEATSRALHDFAHARGWRLRLETRDALAAAHTPSRPDASVLVIGNPPWSARGLGPPYVESLVRDFHLDELGAPLGERRRGVLADAYVRFLRWSIDAVERARGGAIAVVTNASYLDGPVHRGVRAMLASRFDEVTILDLGGSALVARAPGTIDENVFGVRPAAAIVLAARARSSKRAHAEVRHRVFCGTTASKLEALTQPGVLVAVDEPVVSFRPRARPEAAYLRWPSITEWLPFHAEGIQTNRDELVVDVDRDALIRRLEAFASDHTRSFARAHFDPSDARRALRDLIARGELDAHVTSIAYRPFDTRVAFLHPSLCHRPRPPLLAAMRRSSIALVSVRQDRGALPWSHVALVRAPIDNCYLSARSSCRARAFPSHHADGTPNVSSSIADALAQRGLEVAADTRLAYLAAVLSSTTYTTRFADALSVDYARVPMPRDRETLERLAALGLRLSTLLAAHVAPVRAQRGRALVRVGHHAFDASLPSIEALRVLREEIDTEVRERSILEGA